MFFDIHCGPNIFFKSNKEKDDRYYMEAFHFEIKQGWNYSIPERENFIRARRYLKKLKLNYNDHPFMVAFRDKINKIDVYTMAGKLEMEQALTDFYKERNSIYK